MLYANGKLITEICTPLDRRGDYSDSDASNIRGGRYWCSFDKFSDYLLRADTANKRDC